MICKSSYILLFLKTLIFICLALIFYAFYFTDVVSKFEHRDRTLVFSQEIVDKNATEAPFITFCTQPRAKKTILEKYKLSSGVLNEPNPKDIEIIVSLNKTLDTLFREATFKINVDFEMYIKLWYYEDYYGWKSYHGKMHEGSNNYIMVGKPIKSQIASSLMTENSSKNVHAMGHLRFKSVEPKFSLSYAR